MRPCRGCGAALANHIIECPACGTSLQQPAPRPMEANPGDREEIRNNDRWLWLNYLFFPIIFAIFAGIFGVINWGWLGALLAIPVGVVAFMMCVGADLI